MEPVILIKIIIINDWLAGSSLHTLYQVAAVMKTTLKLGGIRSKIQLSLYNSGHEFSTANCKDSDLLEFL